MKTTANDLERPREWETLSTPHSRDRSIVFHLNRKRVKYGAVLLTGILLLALAHLPIFRGIGSLLIVEDTLEPAAAIVALGGQTPFREIEAAKLYHAGLAPLVVIVREAPTAESEALRELGVNKVPQWELARAVLLQQGVPDAAILIPNDEAVGTLEELQAVWGALGARSWVLGVDPVIGHPSYVAVDKDVRGEALGVKGGLGDKEHGPSSVEQSGFPAFQLSSASSRAHRAGSGETEIGSQRSEVRDQKSPVLSHPSSVAPSNATNATVLGHPSAVALSNATNAINAPMPVILVTSKYHTRRTRLTWNFVSGGRSQAIVRAASGDPFDPERWWKQRSFVLSVVREYLGLANYYAGFPVSP